MPLPAQYARLDGLIDIIVNELVREIETDSDAQPQPCAIERADCVDAKVEP